MKRIAILGSALGGGAGQIIEVMQNQINIEPVFILDTNTAIIGKKILGVEVCGSTSEVFERWHKNEFDEVIIAIGGDLIERERLYSTLITNGIPLANVIDTSVQLGIDVIIGKGNVILNNSYIGNNVIIGDNNYILNQCSVQHNTTIGNHNYFSTNVTLGAKVTLGSLNRLGVKCAVETNSVVGDNKTFQTMQIIK